jgi:hypothetical protein
VPELDLDDDEGLRTGVGDPMDNPDRDITALVRLQVKGLIAPLDEGLPLDDDPVLAPTVMVLEAQAVARSDDQALDLIIRSLAQKLPGPPRSLIIGRLGSRDFVTFQ